MYPVENNSYQVTFHSKGGINKCICIGMPVKFLRCFLYINPYLLYSLSALLGVAAAVLWTAQGNYLTLMSSKDTIGRNSGLFWALLQCSLIFGNLFVDIAFQDKDRIEPETRNLVFSVLGVVSVVGVLLFLALIPVRVMVRFSGDSDADAVGINTEQGESNSGPVAAIVSSFRLFVQPDMLLLSVCFFYTGLELTFFSGVYGTSVGNSEIIHNSKGLIGVCGMFIGAGEILGGGLFGLLGNRTNTYGRDPIVLLGYLVHMACFFLIFLNIPGPSPIDSTSVKAIITTSEYLAVANAFMLGFGDACFNTQIYSLLGDVYSDNSAPAFAIFKFVQSVAAALGFVYSSMLNIYWQLGILMVFGTIGSLSFFKVQWKCQKPKGYQTINESTNE
ncbi:putative UNC93-like protein MFSD11-like [Apostichopus japonicus]|uniref:UNC93-like protein MFSD11 n=1 Tax=Stichopus japonicus TaxID=307972 RepID=A0A2G8L6B6_STIJA|nr:putative UNC93-like protein MFSD11-like [Apostichopus japonicus]